MRFRASGQECAIADSSVLERLAVQLTVLARRHASPTPERAGEVGGIGVAEFAGNIGDTHGVVSEVLLCNVKANLVEYFLERRVMSLEPALQGPVAHANQIGTVANSQPIVKVARRQESRRVL